MRVSIESNICGGKTTCLHLLQKKGYHVHYDTTEQSGLNLKYQSDVKRFSLGYHLQVLHNYAKHEKHTGIQLFESSPFTFKHIYSDLLREKDLFDPDEYELYTKFSDEIGWVPDVIIYLFCNPIVCHERCVKRGLNLSLDYLKQLQYKYETTLDELNTTIKIYKINAQEEPSEILRSIEEILVHNAS
jgi:deoxyadenosine/deoxycytidine kinase